MNYHFIFYFLKVAQHRKGIIVHVSDLIKNQLLCDRVVTSEAWKKMGKQHVMG